MAKKDNKGFSLVEIIIAIAVLTLLITPVVTQLSQTVRVNRKSKLQQYVNDSASKFLEDLKSTNTVDLDARYGATPVTKTCTVVDFNGTHSGDTIDYTAKKYVESDVSLGPDRVAYSRSAILDDLPYVLESEGTATGHYLFKVKYGCTEADLAAYPGFELSDDGAMVQYDSDGFITSIVCEEQTDAVDNPNNIKMGNLTDLDSKRVAIIPGSASNFDREAEARYYAMAMERLRKDEIADPNNKSWSQAILNKNDDGILNDYGFMNSLRKMTKIYVNKITLDGQDAYEVAATVYYHSSSSYFSPADSVISFEAYYQIFKMDECPNIYFEYQPFTVDVAGSAVHYANDDYIVVENNVPDARIYLYKPYKDEMFTRNENTGSGYVGAEATYGREDQAASFYTDSTNASSSKVKTHVLIGTSGTECKDFAVYTNIDTANICTDISNMPAQFSIVASKKQNSNCLVTEIDDAHRDNYKVKNIKTDEGRKSNFYNIRVSYVSTEDAGYRVLLTGAKGDN